MSAVLRLSEYEKQLARDECVKEHMGDVLFVAEALAEVTKQEADFMELALKEKDWFRFGEVLGQVLYRYLDECGELQKAVDERQGQLERSGRGS